MEQPRPEIPDVPCPRCGSEETIGKLREKRVEVKRRTTFKPRYQRPPPPSAGATGNVVIGALNPPTKSVAIGHGATVTGNNAIAIGPAIADEDSLVLGSGHAAPGRLVINDAVVDVCADCGNIFSPNALRLAHELRDEIYRMDILGALAEIPGSAPPSTEVRGGYEVRETDPREG